MDRHNKTIKILQWNANGLNTHSAELKHHILNTKPNYDIICIQETHLKPTNNFSIEGFEIIRKDRIGHREGGVVTFISKGIKHQNIPIIKDLEVITIQIITKNSTYTITNIYI